MTLKSLTNALRNFGVTEKEAEVYIFLVKGGTLKTGQIAKQLSKNKGTVYRILSNLRKKGLVEATLESPIRYTAISLEKIIDSYIKSRREEVAYVEKTKKDLLRDWERINKTKIETSPDKFRIIEGRKKIYQKITEMVENTKSNLLAISTVSDLVRGERLGVFDAISAHSKKSTIKFRFLTELTKQNLKTIKLLKSMLKGNLNVKARNPDLGLALFPRIVIRDEEEILFYLSSKKDMPNKEQEICIHTNSTSLIQAFATVFEDLWQNSSNIEDKIIEIETGKPTQKTIVISDEKNAREKYIQTLRDAKKEIMVMTSSENLTKLNTGKFPLKELMIKGVAIKIMAPITIENLEHIEQLSEFCEVRHVTSKYLGTTIIDNRHLFQFKPSLSDKSEPGDIFSFKNTFYTTDSAYLDKMKKTLENIWRSAYKPSKGSIQSKMESSILNKTNLDSKRDLRKLPERFFSAKQSHHQIASGIGGEIIIEPPKNLNMPTMRILPLRFDHAHSKGGTNLLRIDLWLKTLQGEEFIPVAIVTDAVPKMFELSKAQFAGTPAGDNHILVKPEELQVWSKGKNLSAGWTIAIPLLGSKYVLEPACIMFEAFGDEIHSTISYQLPSGYLMGIEFDGYQAFTTYIGPSWKYSGPGIYGSVGDFLLVVAKPEIT